MVTGGCLNDFLQIIWFTDMQVHKKDSKNQKLSEVYRSIMKNSKKNWECWKVTNNR